jgi:diguanylate cyclase (GGDEF)-like protein
MPERMQRAHAASIDPATGLYDGWTIKVRATEEISRARRYRYPVSLVVVAFPSTEQRLIEERVRQLADLLERHVREADILARYGYDSLALLLPHTDEAGVRCVGERIQQLAMVMQLPEGLGGMPLPVCVGVTTVPEDYFGDGAAVVDYLGENLRSLAAGKSERCVFVPLSSRGVPETQRAPVPDLAAWPRTE